MYLNVFFFVFDLNEENVIFSDPIFIALTLSIQISTSSLNFTKKIICFERYAQCTHCY